MTERPLPPRDIDAETTDFAVGQLNPLFCGPGRITFANAFIVWCLTVFAYTALRLQEVEFAHTFGWVIVGLLVVLSASVARASGWSFRPMKQMEYVRDRTNDVERLADQTLSPDQRASGRQLLLYLASQSEQRKNVDSTIFALGAVVMAAQLLPILGPGPLSEGTHQTALLLPGLAAAVGIYYVRQAIWGTEMSEYIIVANGLQTMDQFRESRKALS